MTQTWVMACIGPSTAKMTQELLGRPPDVVASEHTVAGLIAALEEAWAGH